MIYPAGELYEEDDIDRNISLAKIYIVSVLGQDEGYTVKYSPVIFKQRDISQ